MKSLTLTYISWVLTTFFGIDTLQAKNKIITSLAVETSFSNGAKRSKKSKEKLLSNKSTSRITKQKVVTTTLFPAIFITGIYLIIKQYSRNIPNSSPDHVIDEELFKTRLINAVHYTSAINLAALKKVRQNVGREILNSPIFDNNTTALEYTISKVADEKVVTILIDEKRTSQHLIHAIFQLYRKSFRRGKVVKPAYYWLISTLLSKSDFRNRQLLSTHDGWRRRIYLALSDQQYTSCLEEIINSIDQAVFSSHLFDNRGCKNSAIELVMSDINILRISQRRSHMKIFGAIKVANMLLKQDLTGTSLTPFCFSSLIESIKRSDERQEELLTMSSSIEEQLLILLEKMTLKASIELINEALSYALSEYYSPVQPRYFLQSLQEEIFATLLDKQGLTVTDESLSNLKAYGVPIPITSSLYPLSQGW